MLRSFRRNRIEPPRDFWAIPEPDPHRERLRALGETLCGPVVLRSVGIIGLTGAIAALVAINPLKLDGASEATPVGQVVLQPTVASDWDSSLAFTGSLPSKTAAEARTVTTIDPADLTPSVAATSVGISETVAPIASAPAPKGARIVSIARPEPAAETLPSTTATAEPTVAAGPAAPPVAWAPDPRPQPDAASTDRAMAGAGSPGSPDLVALVAAPADPDGAIQAIEDEALGDVTLPKPRPAEVPEVVKAKVSQTPKGKATTPKAGELGPPPDCGNLHAYWRYTDRKKGLRQWHCR